MFGFIDLTGKEFGNLKVLHRCADHISSKGVKYPKWVCICKCGKECDVWGETLRSGKRIDCGCERDSRRKRNKKVLGVGINDAPFKTSHFGEQLPEYKHWLNMLSRAYDVRVYKKQPNYIGTEVCSEWLYFMNFREWALPKIQDGFELDKDILVQGNKVYSPDTCLFVPKWVNSFIASAKPNIRVRYKNTSNPEYLARTSNKVTKLENIISVEKDYESAVRSWVNYKIEILTYRKDELDSIDIRLYPSMVSIFKSKLQSELDK